MGAGLDVLASCDGAANGQEDDFRSNRPGRIGGPIPGWNDDASVGCAALEEATKSAIASANRGGTRISDEVLLNHELLQHARQGNAKGLSAALEKGAWTETRRPLVMKPQKPEVAGGKNGDGGANRQDKVDQVEVGMTALMFSAQSGSAECVRRLLWASAEVNAVEEDGWSALHFAAKEANLEVCKALLQGRADSSIINAEDKTPLQVAQDAEDEGNFVDRLAALIAKAH